jgi:hypothetical protein
MSYEINSKNIIMGRSDEVSEDAYKVFEELQRVAKECRKVAKAKEIQEFISCFKKDHQGVFTQVKQVILLHIDNITVVRPNVSTSSPSITYEDIFDMFVDCGKNEKSHATNDS